MKKKVFIFDMDGTVVDTERIWMYARQKILETRGVSYEGSLKHELDYCLRGVGGGESCRILKDVARLNDPLEQLIQEEVVFAREAYDNGIVLMPGFVDFYHQMELHAVPRGIATNATPDFVTVVDKAVNIRRFFGEHIYDISFVDYLYKPDPAIFLHVADCLEAKPEECIVFEDSPAGIAAARAANMYCVGIASDDSKHTVKDAQQTIHTYCDLDIKKLIK